MNGQLYKDYNFLYDQYAEYTQIAIDRDMWIAFKWLRDTAENEETRYLDPDRLIEKLLKENEIELLDVIDRGLRKVRELEDKYK